MLKKGNLQTRISIGKVLRKAWPILFLMGLVFVGFWKVFAGGVHLPVDILYEETYPWKFQKPGVVAHMINNRDPIYLEFPLQAYITESIRGLKVPLWNPYLAGGGPELGTGIFGVFYPLNGVYYLLPQIWAINIDVMLHAFLAGLFMYLYVYYIGRSVVGGIVAGASFMFSGIFTVYYSHYPVPHVIAWLPLAFLCVEKLFVEQRLKYSVLLGGVIAVQLLVGLLELIFYNFLAILVYVLLRAFVVFWKSRSVLSLKRPFELAMLSAGIGLSLGAIQLIPSMELIPLSQRIFRPYHEIIPLGRSSWLSLLTAFSPNVFGSLPDRNWFGPGYPTTTMIYIGVAGFLLMLICLLIRLDKYVFVLAGVGLVAWLIALGTPFVYLLYKFVPGFSGLRHVGRAIYLHTVVAAALAGLGVATLEQGMTERATYLLKRFFMGAVLVWFVVALGAVGVAVWKDRLLPVAMDAFWRYGQEKGWMLLKSPSHYAERINWMIQYELVYGAVFLGLSGVILLLISGWQKGWIRAPRFQMALVSLAVVDLLSYSLGYVHIVDATTYPVYKVSDSVAFLKQDRDKFRVASLLSCGAEQAFPPNTLMPYGIETIQGYNSFLPGRFGQFLHYLEGDDGTCGGDKHQNIFMIKHFQASGMGQLLNVKYVITPPVGPLLNNPDLRLVFNGEVRIYQNLRFLPRTFFVSDARWAAEDKELLRQLQQEDFDPRSVVMLKGDAGGQIERRPSSEGTPAEVFVVDYQPSAVSVAVNAPTEGWVVLLDNDFPGWRASVDGNPARIYQANFTFRAVNVPAGRHRIEFSYRPLSFTLGVLVTGSALLACAMMLWRDKRRGVIQC